MNVRVYFCLTIILILKPAISNALHDSIENKRNPLREYPALLWEITGKQLDKPSYLYAAIETSDRLAYHLTDRFFTALKSVDQVMLDVHPDSIQHALQQPEIIKRIYQGLITTGYVPDDDAYYNLLVPQEFTPTVFNHILSAHSAGNNHFAGNNQEDRSLSDFIHLAAIKLDKKILGAISYISYLDISDISDEISNEIQKNRRNKRIDYELYQGLIESIYDAYRQGNLGLFDSLYKQLIDYPEYFEKVHGTMKDQLVEGLISGINQGSVFALFDATLLAGSDGLIETLRNKGYNLRPIPHEILNKPSKQKEKLEKKTTRVSYIQYYSEDSTWTLPLPTHVSGGFIENDRGGFGTDLLNDISYRVERYRLHAQTTFQSPEYLFARMDSMVYEMVPGKILKRNTTTCAGFPALEVLSRTSGGRLDQIIIVITPLEAIVFHTGGPVKSMKRTRAGKKLLKRASLIPHRESWTDVTTGHGEFMVQLPSYHIVDSVMNRVFVSPDITYEAWDQTTSSFYHFRRNLHHDLNVLEQDTFDLNYMALQIAEEFKRSIVTEPPTLYERYPSLVFTLLPVAPQTDTLFAKLIIRGAAHYLMMTGARNLSDRIKFFEGLQLLPFSYELSDQLVTDSTLHYSVISSVPLFEGERDEDMPGFLMGWGIEEEEEEDDSHMEKLLTSSYFFDKGGEYILVERLKMHDYRGYESYAHLWEDLLVDLFLGDPTLIIASHEMDTTGAFPALEIRIRANGTHREVLRKYVLHHGVIFTLSAMHDTLKGAPPYTKQFFDSFQPMADTLTGRSPFEDKALLFMESFCSEDTNKVKQAIASMDYVRFKEQHRGGLYDLINDQELMRRDISTSMKLVRSYGSIKGDNCETDLAELYHMVSWSPSLQVTVLGTLLEIDTETAIKKALHIIINDVPMPASQDVLMDILPTLRNKETASAGLFPDMMEYLRYQEYAPFIIQLLSYLVENGLYTPENDPVAMDYIRKELDIRVKRGLLSNQKDPADDDFDILFRPSLRLSHDQHEVGSIIRCIEKYIKPITAVDHDQNDTIDLSDTMEYSGSRLMHSSLFRLFQILYEVPAMRDEMVELAGSILGWRDKNDALAVALFLHEKGEAVHDSIWKLFAADPRIRGDFYREAMHGEVLHLFDTAYANSIDMATSFMFNHASLRMEDSVEYVGSRWIATPHTEGNVYFFKYLSGRGQSRAWHLGATGVFPSTPKDQLPYDPDFVDHRATRIFSDDVLDDLMDKHMNQLRTLHRKRFKP